MKPRTWILLVAGLVAVAAAIAGSLVAIGLGGEDRGRPTGAETVLRIEPADQEVRCGAAPATILIFLDDLEARPSPQQPDVSYGVAAFQVLLRYDPEIVRIADPIDVQLNPRLSEEDADGDGVARSFFPVSSIDDFAGRALLGAGSIVPSGGADRLEEGLDPVGRGGPLLLMTVRFQTVGHGTTALTLDDPGGTLATGLEPGVIDPSLERYESVVFRGAGLTVTGGDCPEPPPATPRPTPKPTATPFVPPTPTPVVWSTVTAPEAPAVGRTDCPADWVVYTDPEDRFSICYPADFSATASHFAVNIDSPATGRVEGAYSVGIAVSWERTPGTIYHPPSPENCATYSVLGQTLATGVVELPLSGGVVPACFTQGLLEGDPALPIGSIQGAVPVAADKSDREGYVRFYVGFIGAEFDHIPVIGKRILQSLSVNYR